MMMKKTLTIVVFFLLCCPLYVQCSSAFCITGQIDTGEITLNYRNVTVYAPAVGKTDNGYVGVISTITVTIQDNGNGRVFVDTLPLTQIDMQGSARLAVKVASALVKSDRNCSVDPSEYDYFFVVRTSAPIIGGPSAGGDMTVATIALLENWTMDNKTVMTGMINPDGSIGSVGGIVQKIDAAASVGATCFLIPKGQGIYMETITETNSQNGITQITTRQEPRYVSDYALDNYGIEVIEVNDVNDAVRYFTGFNFSTGEPDGNITTENYTDSMKPLATTLLEEATSLYENASEWLNNSDIPDYYPLHHKSVITDFLQDAADWLDGSETWYEQGFYYSSTSKSFNSLIGSRFVLYACEYFNADDGEQYILSLLGEATALFSNNSELAKNAEINGMISLQCVGGAQKRAFEAESYLSDASDSYKKDFLGALYYIAKAMERSKSVGWWIDIASHFNDSGDISNTTLENLAVEYIEDAQQATAYSSIILQEMGRTSSYLSEGEELLDAARAELEKGYPAAALFEALEALVKTNLALELVSSTSEEKIDRARESAGSSICESRDRGMEPVLAVSYYEYAASLTNESNFESALVYYRYSGIIAGALSFTNLSAGNSSSRYVGIPETKTPVLKQGLDNYSEYLIYMALLGGMAGLGIGLIIGSLTSKKQQKKVYKKWMPRNIDDYYKKQKKYFSKEEIPRSISNYYKKNK